MDTTVMTKSVQSWCGQEGQNALSFYMFHTGLAHGHCLSFLTQSLELSVMCLPSLSEQIQHKAFLVVL